MQIKWSVTKVFIKFIKDAWKGSIEYTGTKYAH